VNCYHCNQPVATDRVEVHSVSKDADTTDGAYHPACWNYLVQYLEDQYKEWQDAKVQTNSRRKVPGTTAEAGRTPRTRLGLREDKL
jgi:hypothetical protein